VTRYIILLLFIFLYGCSFNTNSRFWTEEKEVEKLSKNISKILEKKLITKKEFNPNLKIDTSKKFRSISDDLSNNLAIKNFNIDIDKISKFKFSKIRDFEYFEPELVFDGKNFVFFDDQGNLIKFDENFKIVWKKNFYSKEEKKQKPILTLSIKEKTLIVFDNISKFYAVNLENGGLLWSKKNKNPIN